VLYSQLKACSSSEVAAMIEGLIAQLSQLIRRENNLTKASSLSGSHLCLPRPTRNTNGLVASSLPVSGLRVCWDLVVSSPLVPSCRPSTPA